MEITTDTLNRRSRWGREGTKQAQLTERDLNILWFLQRYRYLSADFIHAFVGGDKTRFRERMNKLYREPNCYVARPEQQRQYFNANYRPLIYELDRRGERALQDFGRFDPTESVVWLNQGRESHTTFAHSVMICEALASVELGLRGEVGLRFIPWKEIHDELLPEKTRTSKFPYDLPVSITHHLGGKPHRSDKALRPDALFGIEVIGKGRRFFAVECDRDNEPIERSNLEQTSYLRKLLQYRAAIGGRVYKSHWGLPNLVSLHLTTSEYHKQKIMKLLADLTGGKGETYLLFKTMPSLGDFARPEPPTGRLFTEPWQRAGHPEFYLSQP